MPCYFHGDFCFLADFLTKKAKCRRWNFHCLFLIARIFLLMISDLDSSPTDMIKIYLQNRFQPFSQIPSERRRKKLTLPKPNQCRSIHGSAAYVLEITSLLGIALLALIDDKFMRFLFSFTIFGVFQTSSQTQLFSSFHGYKSKLSDHFLDFPWWIHDIFILFHKHTQNQSVILTEFFRVSMDKKSKFSDHFWDYIIDDMNSWAAAHHKFSDIFSYFCGLISTFFDWLKFKVLFSLGFNFWSNWAELSQSWVCDRSNIKV